MDLTEYPGNVPWRCGFVSHQLAARRLGATGATLSLLALLAGCGGQQAQQSQCRRGRRVTHSGHYNRPALLRPARPPHDPWGPYIREASRRFDVPERWIREVMRQESGGRASATSRVGAMGLMQVMPGTYAELRCRYGLGGDPYHPWDNIMAGTAYMREMYELYGAPAFLAAYNAGPRRLEDYLWAGRGLPDETRNYVARIGPRIATHPSRRAAPEIYAAAEIPLNIPRGAAPHRHRAPCWRCATSATRATRHPGGAVSARAGGAHGPDPRWQHIDAGAPVQLARRRGAASFGARGARWPMPRRLDTGAPPLANPRPLLSSRAFGRPRLPPSPSAHSPAASSSGRAIRWRGRRGSTSPGAPMARPRRR